jgi:hypothetical protein
VLRADTLVGTVVIVGVLTGCSASTSTAIDDGWPSSDRGGTRMCEATRFSAVEDFGIGFRPTEKPRLIAAYASTGRVLNSWDFDQEEGPAAHWWPDEADARPMGACYFDGSFRSDDGRTYERAVLETDGHRYRLVGADERSKLRVLRPPRR